MPHLAQWLKHARCESCNTLEEAIVQNVRDQLDNLMTYPFVRQAVAEERLSLEGWIYRFEVGEISMFARVDAGSVNPS